MAAKLAAEYPVLQLDLEDDADVERDDLAKETQAGTGIIDQAHSFFAQDDDSQPPLPEDEEGDEVEHPSPNSAGGQNPDLSEEESDTEEKEPAASSRGLDDLRTFCRENTFFAPFTRSELAGIKLLDVLRKKKAPMNAYASIFDWHLREEGVLSDLQTLKDAGRDHFIGRNTLINRLAGRYNMHHKKPVEKVVRLPVSKEVVRIPVFDAEDCVVNLLTNPKLEDDDFDFFNEDPLAPPPPDLDYIGNVNTGSAFRETYKRMITGPNQQLIGIIFYIDGATTGHFVDLPITAVKFSLSIFTREARLKEHTWAILGYLPQVKIAEGRGKKIFQESKHLEAEEVDLLDGEGEEIDVDGDQSDDSDTDFTMVKAQDFHFMLSIILDSFVKVINDRGMLWEFVYKNHLYPKVHLKFAIMMVRCDTDEADVLCGKYKTRTGNVKQLCRQCHCPTKDSDNHRANYRPKTQKEIQKLVSKDKIDQLQEISQHYIKNAWYKCRFNLANDRGIHGACPSEMLHAMQLGIFKYVRDIFFAYIGKDAQVAHEINALARIYGKLLSHQSERSLPNTNFSKGIKEGRLMAKDYRGILLIMAAVLMSTSGRDLLSTKRKFKMDTRKDDWLLLVELLLEWESFLCSRKMKKSHVARLDKKHRYIMYIMKKVAKRSEGMGLNIMKFHAIVHMMEDILTNGVPLEFDTAANESHHKASKYAALLTQRNEAKFLMQVAVRLWEFDVLNYALNEISTGIRPSDYFLVDDSDSSLSVMSIEASDSSPNSSQSDESSSSSDQSETIIKTDDAMIQVGYDSEDDEITFNMVSRGQHRDKTSINTELLHFLFRLQEEVFDYLRDNFLPIYTRHQRGDVIFHAHPNYRGQGPWKDWAIIDWGPGYGQLPCHIHAFVKLQGLPEGRDSIEFGGIKLKDGVFAVVEEARVEESELARSDLMVPCLKTVEGIEDNQVTGRVFFLADTEAFVKPCAMIPDIGGPCNRYFLVKSRDEWVKEFTHWLLRPHHEDVMSDEEGDD